MLTFSLPQCPHCTRLNAPGTVNRIDFSATESLNFALIGQCQSCQQPMMGLGKIAFAYRFELAEVRQLMHQHQGPLEALRPIQLIRWLPLPAHAQS
ncbi:hypothetical protein AB8Q18_08090 [Neisseriaceae bacterium CLB008]|nr:hypothetical protein [Neisseriaceae bacterium]